MAGHRRALQAGLSLLAEKVETQAEFREAVSKGFRYFQGYFFAEPVITCTREIPAFKLNYLRILQKLHDTDLDVGSLSKLIARKPGSVVSGEEPLKALAGGTGIAVT